MDHVLAARSLMGISLGFHIIYVAFGIGFPLLLLIAEGMAFRTGNDLYHQVARSWTRPMIVLFAIGAVSGTILSFELGLLWPVFMSFGGPMIGLPFWLEGFAFFTEAIFLGLYVYGGRRLSRRALFLTTIPIALSSLASAYFVISANGWMNTPAGFDLVGGSAVNIRPMEAMANPSWWHEALHGSLATYVASGFAIAGVYAYHMLKGRNTPENRLGLSLAMAMGGLLVPFMLVTGDYSAKQVALHQPAKLAAMEALTETRNGAPLVIGGWFDSDTETMRYGIEIPKLLSWLAFDDPDARVLGLNAFPRDRRPNVNVVHLSFDLMIGSFFIMFGAMLWYWLARWKKKDVASNRPLLTALIAASPFGLIAQECGWFVTEFGRQPWIARDVMLVAEGVTPRTGIDMVLLVFLLVYLALTAGLLKLLLTPAPLKSGIPGPKPEQKEDYR